MAKWHGKVGYTQKVQTKPGVWQSSITEREYDGDVLKNTSGWSRNPDSTNDDLRINNRISIVADQFAYQNFHSIKYVEFMGSNWKVTDIEVSSPRLILSIGGLYTNGK